MKYPLGMCACFTWKELLAIGTKEPTMVRRKVLIASSYSLPFSQLLCSRTASLAPWNQEAIDRIVQSDQDDADGPPASRPTDQWWSSLSCMTIRLFGLGPGASLALLEEGGGKAKYKSQQCRLHPLSSHPPL